MDSPRSNPVRPMTLAALVTLAAGASLAQSRVPVGAPVQVPAEIDSPPGQIRCWVVITPGEGAAAVSTGLEFMYPQGHRAEYLGCSAQIA